MASYADYYSGQAPRSQLAGNPMYPQANGQNLAFGRNGLMAPHNYAAQAMSVRPMYQTRPAPLYPGKKNTKLLGQGNPYAVVRPVFPGFQRPPTPYQMPFPTMGLREFGDVGQFQRRFV